jgi:GH25 family lysozyme M1 (1,4-beta-N-acetylmuramidase)
MSKAWAELNKGNRMGIILFRGGKAPNGMVWTAGGHYVAFTDYYVKNGKHYFYTKDSGSRNHDSLTKGYYTYENSMKGLVYQMWIVEKPNATTTTTTTTSTSTAAASTSKSIAVDGDFGVNSVTALQKVLGTTQDGKLGGQLSKLKKYHSGISSISYGSGGSQTIRALQKYLGLSGPDGQLGPNTIKALQKYLGMSGPDGYWGPNTSRAVQRWINSKLNGSSSSSTPSVAPAQSTSVKLKGMDVSAWQGNISKANFEKAKNSGIQFVILRLGYTGSSSKKPTIDKVFENNYKNAIAAGLPVGIYFYSLATSDSKAKEEANFCIANLKGKTITYPVYIDMEDNATQGKQSKSTLASVCNTFCNTIAAAGYKSGVYASLSWFNNKIGSISAPHSKWVAQYYSKCEYKGAYDIWQYSSSEKVPGIADKVDVNWCYKKF